MCAWTEIVDFTFTANETSRAFTGLNITKDDFIKIVVTHVNTAVSAGLSCFPNTAAGVNGFDTATNYHLQILIANGTSVSANRLNTNEINSALGNNSSYTLAYLKISENNRVNIFSNPVNRLDSSLQTRFVYLTSSGLTFNDPITSLTFTATQTNALGTGSRIQIYRLDAVKEADITTTANATQVDISSLSIGKDSEYLLVGDLINGSASTNELRITPNDLTTESDYYFQRITGSDTTAGALRTNVPGTAFIADGNKRAIGYAHIKLSEIGAYTLQSYGIRVYGESGMSLSNYFVSSTSEAITSITKLNLKAGVTNGIGTGSTFVLYKLK
jgi:hypothetical protein